MRQIMAVDVWQRRLWQMFFWVCLCCVSQATWAMDSVQPVPVLTGPVMDQANMMSPEAQAQLDASLRQYTKDTGSQVAVLTVDTTAPEDVFSYAIRVVKAWQLGREAQDDGVLLVIAKDDRKNQIVVGRGLEGAITDVDAHRILSEIVKPHFQQGEFDQGITLAVEKIQSLIAGEALPEPSMDQSEEATVIDLLVGLTLPMLFVTSILKTFFGRQGGSIVSAVGAMLLLWFFGVSWLWMVACSVGVYLFSYIVNVNLMNGGGSWHDGGDGWSSGGSDWGGGSDSYSGGGGSFSGGGASGDW